MTQASRLDHSTQSTISSDVSNVSSTAVVNDSIDLSYDNTMALACVADSVVTLENEAQLDDFMAAYIEDTAD